ncbi:MAG: acetate--CoA ligase family protein [Candidatus Jordarchaeum sp.]|uniref:acetate--CoA ligase family protein n=1 Tax=Candidatus Jordarchaeum sp. TaxID=2823881 RepID=UPI00404B66F1
MHTIEEIIEPSTIAIVGSARRNEFYFLRSLVAAGFKGAIYPVNPHVPAAYGLKFYKSLSEIPDKIDYVICAVKAKYVPGVVKECVKMGVKAINIFSSGFGESGTEEGKLLEKEILEIAKEGGVRILGPNCMGIYYPEHGLSFRTDLRRKRGPVGFVSQSGGHAISFSLAGNDAGLFFSKVFSFGNGIDITATELIEFLTRDEKTKIITVYVEGVKDGAKFMRAIKEAALEKPVIIWKGGKTEAGSRAAASHTGSIAGSPEILEAVFTQTNVVTVESFDELLDTSLAFAYCPHVYENRVGLISISGGSGVTNSDACIKMGLRVPQLSEETRKKLGSVILGAGTSVKNPVDLAGSYLNPDVVATTVETLGDEPYLDSLIFEVQVHYPSFFAKFIDTPELAAMIYKTISDCCKKVVEKNKKPVLIAIPPIGYHEAVRVARDMFLEANLPVFPSVDRAAKALADMYKYYKKSQRLHELEKQGLLQAAV